MHTDRNNNINMLTHTVNQFPFILQKGTIMTTFCNNLWTTNVEVNSVAHMFNMTTGFQQCVGIVRTKLYIHQFTLITRLLTVAASTPQQQCHKGATVFGTVCRSACQHDNVQDIIVKFQDILPKTKAWTSSKMAAFSVVFSALQHPQLRDEELA